MKIPFFSIIIPVFNVEKFLVKCLDSIIHQDFTSYEVICINDGSIDNSINILKEYQQKYTQINIISQDNQGQAAARNRGINASIGKYLLFVDSDDWIKSGTLKSLFTIINNSGLDILCFNGERYDENDGSILNSPAINKSFINGWEYFNERSMLLRPSPIPFYVIWNKCYLKEFLNKNRLFFDESLPPHEDIAFVCESFFYAGSIREISSSFYYYRIRKGSDTNNYEKRIQRLYAFVKTANRLSDFFIPKSGISKSVIYHHIRSLYYETFEAIRHWDLLEKEKDIKKCINWKNFWIISDTVKQKLFVIFFKLNPALYFFYKKTAHQILIAVGCQKVGK